VCSSCRDKLEAAGKGGTYYRCYAMERVVGCDARPPYYAHEEHLLACPHAPCHCPGGEACGFAGSVAALLDHIASAHSWPCETEPPRRGSFMVFLSLTSVATVTSISFCSTWLAAIRVAAPCPSSASVRAPQPRPQWIN